MKTTKNVESRGSRVEGRVAEAGSSRHPSPVTRDTVAFTLIELLTVIAVIAAIAALIFPVASTVKRQAFIHNAQAQMAQLETALESYKSACGFYPPASLYGPLTNQLYFELVGTVLTNGFFQTLDGSAQIKVADVPTTFGAGGFMNCNKPGGDESAQQARNFLPDLKADQIYSYTNTDNGVIKVLVAPNGGPDPDYKPFGGVFDVNPWRYVYPGTNNPGSYDLWVQLKIAGKTNLICNWTKQVQINNNSVP
jgi:type II secretory pathway pseudopilin PulG